MMLDWLDWLRCPAAEVGSGGGVVVDLMVVNEDSAECNNVCWEEEDGTAVILLFVVIVGVTPGATVLAELCPNREKPDRTDPVSDPFERLERGEVALLL
jgi:hypothetical protein